VKDDTSAVLNGGNVVFAALNAQGNAATNILVDAGADLAATIGAACSVAAATNTCTDAVQTQSGVGTRAQVIVRTDGAAAGTYTLRARVMSGSTVLAEATAPFTLGGAPDSVSIAAPTNVGVTGNTTGTISVTV